MADVRHLKDKGVPLKIDGTTRYVRGATKYTTCADVIKMVLKKTGIGKDYRHLFAIYEVSLTGERLIPCQSRIFKVIEAWGDLPYKLIFRKTDPMATAPVPEQNQPVTIKANGTKQKGDKTSASHKSDEDSYMKTLMSLANFVEKQKNKLQGRHSDTASASSESDSSMDEFLSNLDRSRMAGFVHFFAAMAGNKNNSKASLKTGSSTTSSRRRHSDTDESSELSPSSNRRQKKETGKDKRKIRYKRQTKKTDKGDIHPNKTHKIERVNFGFIDVEPSSRDQIYTVLDRQERVTSVVQEDMPIWRGQQTRKPFPPKRRLLPGKRSSYSMQKNDSCGASLLHTSSTSTSEDDYQLPGKFKSVVERSLTQPNTDIQFNLPNDIANISVSSTSSSDFDNAFVVSAHSSAKVNISRSAYVSRIRRCARTLKYDAHGEHSGMNQVAGTDTNGNDAAGQKLVDYTLTDSDISDTELENEINTVNSQSFMVSSNYSIKSCSNVLQRNYDNEHSHDEIKGSDVIGIDHVTKMAERLDVSDYIRSVFNNSCQISEDDAMDSFMRSMICEDSSDEAPESLASSGK